MPPNVILQGGERLDRAAPNESGNNIANAEEDSNLLAFPIPAIQYGLWWCGVNAPPRSELEVVGRLDEEQPASAGGLVEE